MFIIRECFKDGSFYDRATAETMVEAVKKVDDFVGGIHEIINGKFYGKPNYHCGACRTAWLVIRK